MAPNDRRLRTESVTNGESQIERIHRDHAGGKFAQFIVEHTTLCKKAYFGTPGNSHELDHCAI